MTFSPFARCRRNRGGIGTIYRGSWSYSYRRRSPTISFIKPNSNSASFGRYREGGDSRVGYNTGTNSRPGRGNPIGLIGLAWTLSRLQLGVRLAILAGVASLAFNSFYKFKSFWSKFRFKLRTTSIHKIKHGNNSSHNKIYSGMNATNIIIYLYK
jgi:hypothetical protein